MLSLLLLLPRMIVTIFRDRQALMLENLALRQQLAVLQRSVKRPQFTNADRRFWILLYRCWNGWDKVNALMKADTVVRWHRHGFRQYWAWKSRRRQGRPKIDKSLRQLIQNMQRANSYWGAPRIHGELLKLGIEISQATVSNYMIRFRGPPSQTWRTFLNNHAKEFVGIDFFTVPTVTFRILYVFVVLSHDRRVVVHFNVTAHPTAQWTAQQLVEAFPWDSAPKYLLRDRDGIYGGLVRRRIQSLGIKEVKTAPRSPWQNPYVERLIGSIRCDCLDHVIILNERHLRRILRDYFLYYHQYRTHLSLDKDAPQPRAVDPPNQGNIVELPCVGGLHHVYRRIAA